jgi:tRNA A37 threonylcarbamoyladenosine synthetase subunit TsaC/SUA5/YrdC/protein-tyrosine-phosphatase
VGALADADHDSATLRAFKGGRPEPFSLHLPDREAAHRAVNPQGLVEYAALNLTPHGVTAILADERTGKGIGCRVVTHEVGRKFLAAVGKSVVATSANEHGQPPLRDPERIAALPGIDAVLGDGVLPERPASTVVRALPSGLEILREGAVPRDELAGLFCMSVEFVCLGNLNRSAFAHHFAEAVQDWWGMQIENSVPAFEFRSSGLIASPRVRSPQPMIEVAKRYGVELADHIPTHFDPARCAEADYAVAMGPDVHDTVMNANPRTIAMHVLDPMGGPQVSYETTAREVRRLWLRQLARFPHIRESDATLEAEFEKLFSGTGDSP